MAEPIEPKFFVGPHVTPWKVNNKTKTRFDWKNDENVFWKCLNFLSENLRKFVNDFCSSSNLKVLKLKR